MGVLSKNGILQFCNENCTFFNNYVTNRKRTLKKILSSSIIAIVNGKLGGTIRQSNIRRTHNTKYRKGEIDEEEVTEHLTGIRTYNHNDCSGICR